MIERKWSSEIPLVFAHVVLTKTLGTHKAREIRARIDSQLDLWERGMHAGLAGDALVEGRAQEDRVKRRVEEEEDCLHAHHCAVGKSAVGGLSGLQQRGVGGGGWGGGVCT